MSLRTRTAISGFTLVELLVTLSLMTVVFGILVSMMMGGAGIWERVKCGVLQDHGIYIAFDKMRRGLHSAHPFTGKMFKGTNDKLEFPALLTVQDEKTGEIASEPGQISYYFYRSRKRLCQTEQFHRGARKRRYGADLCVPLAENIEKVYFRYRGYNADSKSSSWTGYWSDKQFPLAVKLELDYGDPCTEKKSKKEFLVSIPVGPIG